MELTVDFFGGLETLRILLLAHFLLQLLYSSAQKSLAELMSESFQQYFQNEIGNIIFPASFCYTKPYDSKKLDTQIKMWREHEHTSLQLFQQNEFMVGDLTGVNGLLRSTSTSR